MHVTLNVPIQIEAFGGKLFSGIFLITFCHTIREVEKLRELSKNAIKRVGHRLSFSDNWQKTDIWRFFLWTFSVALVMAMMSQPALKYCPTKELSRYS